MPHQIRRFGVMQTAKVVGALYALLGLVFVPIVLVLSMLAPKEQGMGPGLALALPILYGVFGFIFAALGCALYNLVAGLVGGVEVELSQSPTG
jgi:hypothetical protein